MINSVHLKNFKGHNREFQLGAATMIVGENFRGKTGLFQAIALGVHGWLKHPTGDKKLDPWGLASGNPMSIALQLSNDTSPTGWVAIERRWEQDRKGSVRYSGYDGEPLMPPIMLDARTYFDLSADKRMRYVFGAVKLADGAFSADKLIADLKNLKADTQTEAHETALTDVVKTVSDSWKAFSAEKEMGADITVQDWLAKVIETLKERAKLAKQAVDRMVKTVAGITELQLRSTEEIDANTAALDNQLQAVREQIEAKQRELGQLEQGLAAARDAATKLATLREDMKKLPVPDDAAIAREADVNAESTRLTTEGNALSQEFGRLSEAVTRLHAEVTRQHQVAQNIEAIDGELEMYPDQAETLKQLQDNIDQLTKDKTTLTELISASREKLGGLEARATSLHQDREKLKRELSEWEAKLEDLPNQTCCPWCASQGEGFRSSAEASFKSEIAIRNTSLTTIGAEIAANIESRSDLQRRLTDATAQLEKLEGSLRKNNDAARQSQMKQNSRVSLLARREEVLKQSSPPVDVAAAEAAAAECRRKITANNDACIVISKEIANIALMKRARELQAQIDAIPTMTQAVETPLKQHDEIRVLRLEYERLDGDIKKSISAKTDALRQNQAVEERDKAKAEQDMTKLAVEAVTAFQQSMVDKAFGTIIADANRFVSGILDSPLEYANGEIGRGAMRNGKLTFVTHEYLSGTEQALCFAGISAALAMQSPFKLVMIDEMTRLSEKNKQAVLIRMCELIKDGVIHQFVGVDTARKYYDTNEFYLSTTNTPVAFIEL